MSMTESEAIEILLQILYDEKIGEEGTKAFQMAMKSLEEVQQYRAIGTVERFRELEEKATAKKPINRTGYDRYVKFYCPNCDAHLFFDEGQKFCNECGQAIEV